MKNNENSNDKMAFLKPFINRAKRHTFYAGKDGRILKILKILKIDTEIRPSTSAEDMATTLGEAGVEKRIQLRL